MIQELAFCNSLNLQSPQATTLEQENAVLRSRLMELEHQLKLLELGQVYKMFSAEMPEYEQQKPQADLMQERNRIAREIHDTLAQAFTSILMRLQAAELSLSTNLDITQNNLQAACHQARQGLAEARRFVYALRPQSLEQKTFSEALKHCLQELAATHQIACEFCVAGKPQLLSECLEDELLRIAQEAIGNACKHAEASKIEVQLIFMPRRVCLVVRDNGKGFVPSNIGTRRGFGLTSMQERAQQLNGNFSLCSHPGQGTQITVKVKLP